MDDRLTQWFAENPQVALAFSGGVDSSYLLWAARTCGATVRAYRVTSAFQPAFEREDARKLAALCDVELTELSVDVLTDPHIMENGPDRCYRCKRLMFEAVLRAAKADGFPLVIDGTNGSDDADDRPGMKALRELRVRSPLRECGLTKQRIRELSREARLFTWNKPSYACLATRTAFGEPIVREALEATERAEDMLHELGFSDVRVRRFNGAARIQLPREEWPRLLQHADEVRSALESDYDEVFLDLKERKQ